MKKSLAVMLALIMVLCMIPTTAFAADIIDQKNNVYIYKGEPTYYNFLREFSGGSITKQENEEVTWQRLPRYTNICGNCRRVLVEAIPDYYCINPDKNIEITNPEVIGKYGVRVANWKGNDVYNGYPCFEFYCKAAKAGETDVKVTYYYNYNYLGASGYCNYCGRRVTVPAQKNWYGESVTFHVKVVGEDPVGIPDKPTDISGIVGESAVKVHCTNDKSSHADETFALIAGSFTIGDVTKDNASGKYSCNIAVRANQYVDKYNTTHGSHTLDQNENTAVIKLEYNNEKWEKVTQTPVVFNVKCETQEPPTDKPERPEPENTSKPFIELTGKEAVKVHCTNDNANHADKSYGLMHDGYTVGEVQGDKESGYTCEITVNPDKYVEAYNTDISVDHTLAPAGQTGTIHLKYDKEAQKWQLANPSGVPVVFNVKCDNTQPPLDTITIEVSKVWHDDSGTAKKPEKITVLLLANSQEVNRANIEYVNGAWSHSFGAKPVKDNNDKPINYTVKEEDVSGWTPYYWTAGPWNNLLAFQIHNVPTVNTREIKVTKKVSGEGADKEKYFDFKVTLFQDLDGNGEIGVGTHPLSDTYTFGGVTFTNGVATFKLKDGDSKEITGIPSHVQYLPLLYKVEEIVPDGYTVKVNGSAGSSINGAFTGTNAKTVNIAFENIKESGTNPTPTPTPNPTPGGGNGGGGHWHPTTTPVPVIVIPPKTGDMTIWQSILHFLGIR